MFASLRSDLRVAGRCALRQPGVTLVALRLFPGEEPLGRRVMMATGSGTPAALEVVGVAADARIYGVGQWTLSSWTFGSWTFGVIGDRPSPSVHPDADGTHPPAITFSRRRIRKTRVVGPLRSAPTRRCARASTRGRR
jgi:hypothetical protein